MSSPIIRTQVLTADHFEKLQQKTLENTFFEGTILDENGSEREVAVSVLYDPMGLYPIDVQLVSEPRNPIRSIHDVSPIRAGKKTPPPPKVDPKAPGSRVAVDLPAK